MTHNGLSARHLEIIREILAPYADKIEKVGLFGSRATGTFRSNSDIDLVLYGSVDDATIDRLWTLFDNSLLPFKVDVSAYHRIAYAPLKEHIAAVMQPLLSAAELRGF